MVSVVYPLFNREDGKVRLITLLFTLFLVVPASAQAATSGETPCDPLKPGQACSVIVDRAVSKPAASRQSPEASRPVWGGTLAPGPDGGTLAPDRRGLIRNSDGCRQVAVRPNEVVRSSPNRKVRQARRMCRETDTTVTHTSGFSGGTFRAETKVHVLFRLSFPECRMNIIGGAVTTAEYRPAGRAWAPVQLVEVPGPPKWLADCEAVQTTSQVIPSHATNDSTQETFREAVQQGRIRTIGSYEFLFAADPNEPDRDLRQLDTFKMAPIAATLSPHD